MSKIAYILAATKHGSMIVNRFDYCPVNPTYAYGLGHDLLEHGAYGEQELDILSKLFVYKGSHKLGAVALDIGANIGTHTISLARASEEWGKVIAFEAQPKIFYALAGNIAINNCWNADAYNVAVGNEYSTIRVPHIDYLSPASFASLELKKTDHQEIRAQEPDYSGGPKVDLVPIDGYGLDRVDLIKIDIEGMEIEALEGAEETIRRNLPIIFCEHIKTNKNQLEHLLNCYGYATIKTLGDNLLALSEDDAENIDVTKRIV